MFALLLVLQKLVSVAKMYGRNRIKRKMTMGNWAPMFRPLPVEICKIPFDSPCVATLSPKWRTCIFHNSRENSLIDRLACVNFTYFYRATTKLLGDDGFFFISSIVIVGRYFLFEAKNQNG
jgi:hypothetical protein